MQWSDSENEISIISLSDRIFAEAIAPAMPKLENDGECETIDDKFLSAPNHSLPDDEANLNNLNSTPKRLENGQLAKESKINIFSAVSNGNCQSGIIKNQDNFSEKTFLSMPTATNEKVSYTLDKETTKPPRENISSLSKNEEINQFLEGNGVISPVNQDKHHPPGETNQIISQETTGELGFVPVLKNRNFLALWSGQVFSQLADKVYLVLMIALIDSQFQTGNQGISTWVSAIMMAFTIPAVLFGSLAGVFVDRWPKKTVLVITNLLRGGLVIALPTLLWLSKGSFILGGLPLGFCLMLVVTFLVSTLTQFFAPAEQAAIPIVVKGRHLLSANSLYTTTMMGSVIIGFAVGEPLLALANQLMTYLGGGISIGRELLVGGSYAIAGVILLLLKTGEKVGSEEREPPHVLADLRDGFLYLKQQRRVRTALIQLIILFSIFAALSVLAVSVAERIPEMKASQFGFLMAAGGFGLGIGAAILGHYGQRFCHVWLSLWGSAGVAASLIGLSLFTDNLWMVLLLVTLMGGCGALVAVPMQTAIQKETPPEMRGKVFGLQNNAINIALSLPLALAGVAETFFGLKAVFLGLSGAAIAGGLLTWYICRTSSHTLSNTDQPNC
ncbi:MAG TPA: MFS transporter [Leptolyngbyaceae cyanobacterium]